MNTIITIGREFGSGGREFGRRLAEELHFEYYDKEIVEAISKHTSLSEEYVQQVIESAPHPLFPITIGQSMSYTENYQMHQIQKVYQAQCEIIKDLASKSNCVIVGRCAPYVLKDNKDTIKIFLYSSEEDKIKRAIKYYNIPKNKAKKEIEKINKMRDKHYSYYTGSSLYNPSNYDLMINVDSLGVEGAADYIIEYIMQKK